MLRMIGQKTVAGLVCTALFGIMGYGVYLNTPKTAAPPTVASPAAPIPAFSSTNQHDFIWSVYFSPRGGCTAAIVQEITNARESIFVQAYSFTSKPIADALVAAHRCGVHVDVIADSDSATGKGCVLPQLAAAGITVCVDGSHPIAHNKIMIIDGWAVITGSFNFSAQAEMNAENLMIVRCKRLAETYQLNWQKHRSHAQPLHAPAPTTIPLPTGDFP